MNERMKDMKRIVMILMAVALVALPTIAQQQEWQSTSSMQTSGSTYSPQVTAVGADAPATQSPVAAPNRGPLKSTGLPGVTEEMGTGQGNTPLGDALIPLTIMALIYALVVYFRKRKQTSN